MDTKASHIFSSADLWRLIWPLLVEQLLQITVGMADIVMVSSLGEDAVSGVSLVDQINVLLAQLFAALAAGGAVVCSQFIGARNAGKASVSARQLLYVSVGLSLLLMVAGLVSRGPLLSAVFGAVTPQVMDQSQRYFLVTLFALPGIAVYNAAAALFRAQGDSGVSMRVALVANAVNVAGNALLLFGLGWGVEGVAVPTVVSRALGAVILMHRLRQASARPGAMVDARGLRSFSFDWPIVKKILAVGVPSGVENSMFQVGKIIVLSLIAGYGTVAVAANAVPNTIASFEILPGASVGLAMLTVVGRCVGAGRPDEAARYVRRLMFVAYAGVWVVNVPLLFFARDVISVYGLSQRVSDLAWVMVLTHGVGGMLIWPLSFTLPNALRASGQAAFTMITSIVTMWVVRVGLSYVFAATGTLGLIDFMGWPPEYGAEGTWLAMVTDWVVRSALFVWCFRSGRWKSYSAG